MSQLDNIIDRIVQKMVSRLRLGWFDHSSDSFDMRVARARAYRIQQRLAGNRITMKQALWG